MNITKLYFEYDFYENNYFLIVVMDGF